MTKAKISEYDAVAANNTDVNGVNIDEGCAPSGMNNMGREIMAALKRFETGADGDSLTVGGNLIVSGTVTAANTATLGNVDVNGGTIDGTAIGGSTAAAGSFTTLNTSGAVVFNDAGADVDFRVEGDTEPNLLFVDASTDRVGVSSNAPVLGKFEVSVNDTSVTQDGINIRGTAAGAYGGYLSWSDTWSGDSYRGKIAAILGYRTDVGDGALRFFTTEAETLSERARFTPDGYLRMASGSGGIQFNGDTAAANALDDYEEGTWTPSLVASGGTLSVTYGATRSGTYTKIGNVVSVRLALRISSQSGGSDGYTITGLPFAASNPGNDHTGVSTSGFENMPIGSTEQLINVIDNGATAIRLLKAQNNASWANYTPGSAMQIFASFTYSV